MRRVNFYDKQRVNETELDELQENVERQVVADALSLFFGGNSVAKGYAVTAQSPAAMAVDVGFGTASTLDPDVAVVNNKMAKLRAPVVKPIATADPTNPRIDLVVLFWAQLQQDPVTAPNGSIVFTRLDDDSDVQVLQGTPAPSPVAPSVPTGAVPLAEVLVGAGVTSITTGNITDRRPFVPNLNEIENARGTRATLNDRLSQSLDANGDPKANTAIDTVIGDRTADPLQAPASNGPGKLTQWLSWITNRIKAITGTTNWFDAPATTLAAAKAHADAPAPHTDHETLAGAQARVDAHAGLTSAHGATSAPTASRLILRDGSGRAQVAGPSGAADIVTKQYVDDRLPAGVIMMWSGSIETIPAGWALCNGLNGTPDLRDRFVVAAGNNYTPGNSGGANSVTVNAHAHSLPNHTHTFSGTGNAAPSTGNFDTALGGGGPLLTNSNHVHSVSFGGTTNAGGSGSTGSAGEQSLDNRPPYIALAFIMKL